MAIFEESKLLTAFVNDFRLGFRAVYGEGSVDKRGAWDFGVALVTWKLWKTGRVPKSRRRQIAAALVMELDRQNDQRMDIRRRLLEIAEGRGEYGSEFGARIRASSRRSDSD